MFNIYICIKNGNVRNIWILSEIHKVKSSADKEDFKGLTCKQKEFREREGTLCATDIITGCNIDGSKN